MSEHRRMNLNDAVDVLLRSYTRDVRTHDGFEYLEIQGAATGGWYDPKDISLAWDALAASRARYRNSWRMRLQGWWLSRQYQRQKRRTAKAA